MEPLNQLTAETILSDDVLTEVFEQEDEIYKARLLLSLTDRAGELKVKTKFEKLVSAYKKVEKQIEKEKKEKSQPKQSFDNETNFGYGDSEYYCGNWIADNTGVRTFTMMGEQLACYHPILPVLRLINAETGKEKVKLAFQKGGNWKEVIVDKEVVASNSKIVSLAGYGVSVTSETARALVRFLADVENYNVQLIPTQVSTSKFGWIKDTFIPYGDEVLFDGDRKFKDIFESVQEHGEYEAWLQLARSVRGYGRYEPLVYMAASFASILVKPLDALPFIVNLWGDTGKGKTTALMLAVSIWADPREGKYMTDPSAKRTALEVRDDILNNLPMVIDDLSKCRDAHGDEFTDIIYMLCGGKGRDRSNVSLGLNKSHTWCNAVLTNIERPLATDTMQGGAINRILDFEMEDGNIFRDGNNANSVVRVISRNYGFAGRKFVEVVQDIGFDRIREMQQGYLGRINQAASEKGVEKEEKQSMPLSIMLTVDEIAEEYIFKDGVRLDFDRCVDALKNKGEVSENERAYDFIMSEVSVNINKFKPDASGEYKGEVWGAIKDGHAVILNNAFNRICERGNFSNKAFLSWAVKQDLIVQQGGKNTKSTRICGALARCVWLKMPEDGFMSVEDAQMELPFEP